MSEQSEINLSVILGRITTAEAFNHVLQHIRVNEGYFRTQLPSTLLNVFKAFCESQRDELIVYTDDDLKRFKDFKAKKSIPQETTVTISFR